MATALTTPFTNGNSAAALLGTNADLFGPPIPAVNSLWTEGFYLPLNHHVQRQCRLALNQQCADVAQFADTAVC
jgi:hypothetical protein